MHRLAVHDCHLATDQCRCAHWFYLRWVEVGRLEGSI